MGGRGAAREFGPSREWDTEDSDDSDVVHNFQHFTIVRTQEFVPPKKSKYERFLVFRIRTLLL
jgi:hypothetical protein